MTCKALMVVSLVVLIVASALVVPGCSSNDAPPVLVEGRFDAYPGPLTLMGDPELMPLDVKANGSSDQIILVDCTLRFDEVQSDSVKQDSGECVFKANFADDSPIHPSCHDLDLEGGWDQSGNLVEVYVNTLGTAQPSYETSAEFGFAFTGDGAATGTMILDVDGDTYEGTIQIIKQEEVVD